MFRITQIIVVAAVALSGLSALASAEVPRPEVAVQAPSPVERDLVSPDARDSARHLSELPSPQVTDLRSPDAIDASRNVVATYTPGQGDTPAPRIVQLTSDGFSWGDAGIGAAAMLALLALVSGSLMVMSHRRREPGFPGAPR